VCLAERRPRADVSGVVPRHVIQSFAFVIPHHIEFGGFYDPPSFLAFLICAGRNEAAIGAVRESVAGADPVVRPYNL